MTPYIFTGLENTQYNKQTPLQLISDIVSNYLGLPKDEIKKKYSV